VTAPVTHGSWVTWVMGQELNGSLGSWVTLSDPFPALRRSLEANHTLHDVWSYPALLHCIYIFWAFCPLTEFCPVQNSLYAQVLRSLTLPPLLHGTTEAGVSQTLRR